MGDEAEATDHHFSFKGFISGDGMAVPSMIKGNLRLRNEQTFTGTYTTTRSKGGWFPPGDMEGTVNGTVLQLCTLKRGEPVSNVSGGTFDLKGGPVQLVGTNLRKKVRIWKLKLTRTAKPEDNDTTGSDDFGDDIGDSDSDEEPELEGPLATDEDSESDSEEDDDEEPGADHDGARTDEHESDEDESASSSSSEEALVPSSRKRRTAAA